MPNGHLLEALANTRMPYGRYQGRLLLDIPEDYLLWLSQKGFPTGPLGPLLALALEIRRENLEGLLAPLQARARRD